MSRDDLILEVDDRDDMLLDMDSGGDIDLMDSVPYYSRDYNKLENKPRINGITLQGNRFLSDLFPDGIIIDGGGATGWTQ